MVLGAILLLRGGGPFNPGPLTAQHSPAAGQLGGFNSHAEFEEDCGLCHAPWLGPTAERCERCHTAIAAERAGGTGLHGRLADSGRCEACHTDHEGRDALITSLNMMEFDHQRVAAFSLARHARDYDGRPLVCGDCHPDGDYAAARVDCMTCHTAADASFMADHSAQFGPDCVSCHDGVDSMAQFDHAGVFPLDGAHAPLACSDCHAGRVFAGTPRDCQGCHAEPEIHAGQFGLDCARCHTTTAWTPAQLTQHTFPLNHGESGPSECQVCHVQSYAEYTCYGCHEHQEADIRDEHVEEGILDFAYCAQCHPTGLKEEGERDGDN